MFTLFISILIPASLVWVFRLLNESRKPAIFGVYQQKNKFYWFKYILMYITLAVKKLLIRLQRWRAVESGASCDGTKQVHKEDELLEMKYHVGDHPMSVDAVYFNGMSKEGEAIICGLATRPKSICDAFMFLKLNGEELLLTPSLPDTYLQQASTEEREYKVQGIEIVDFIPMRTWKLFYKGEMKPRNDTEKRLKVEMELTWSALWAPFNYDFQMAPHTLASDIARESWSRDYFKLLKKFHQTHYEQMGIIKGTVKIDGKEHLLNMPCVRNHSFGAHRDWRNFHRYVYHFIFLENGDSIAIGCVSQPAILSHLTIGYLCRQSDHTVYPVDSCDFKLYQHGESQIMPKDYGFIFRAGGQSYAVRLQVNDEESFYIGKSREAKFYERWSTVDINDVKGWACVEWQYNNLQAK